MTYYPTLHLEIARYIEYTTQAKYELPWTLLRLVGPPPTNMAKPGRGAKDQSKAHGQSRSTNSSPVKRSAKDAAGTGVRLPAPQKMEPIKM